MHTINGSTCAEYKITPTHTHTHTSPHDTTHRDHGLGGVNQPELGTGAVGIGHAGSDRLDESRDLFCYGFAVVDKLCLGCIIAVGCPCPLSCCNALGCHSSSLLGSDL